MSRNSPSQSGVFSSAVDTRVEKFTESISFDHRLYAQDIRGSIAHAEMLADVGVLTEEEATQITTALALIKTEIDNGDFQFDEKLEDVHMNIESALVGRLGDVGRKLHTGRSRNDQVATDARLWVRDAIDETDRLLKQLQAAFVGRCDADIDIILPAYTHMQRAQPVLAPHYWLAYTEKLERDRQRLADCRRRVNVCSLGTAALAGTTIPIDRENVAKRLGFEGVAANSIDVSSDRDFLVEYAFCLTMIAEHLSVWADEWVLWSSVEFKFIQIPQQFCTGSSIMPQKINPDVCELIRGKSARVIGNLQALLVLIKGLPLAYNRDLQEDKERLFDSVDTVHRSLDLAASIVEGAKLNTESINSRLEDGFLDATTLMEYLIGKGTPQRTAHHQIGSLVATAMDKRCRLAELPLADFTAVNDSLDESVYDVLGVAKAVAAFRSYGSTSPEEVKKQVVHWKEQLELG
ncbi:argininosuccinate lyase [Blastopirellula marina]|uniref:Argininosuccinate lyase n=1 Tax=Blastopirellula marina TaxID=124 RepID=A0A2S8FHQ8_9BACT|nr:argininosuccinate lyase [Blastopirellula marina]PQO31683.1 argininosuccinate lyase [Blastopirellula marina]PTL42990.1 argininosuccinate lyase [Blastopirellula marina]